MKTATIQARIEPKLKKEVEAILAKMGMTASQAISMYYASIKHHKGIPFESRIPNKGLRKAMRDVDLRRNLEEVRDVSEMIALLSSKKTNKKSK